MKKVSPVKQLPNLRLIPGILGVVVILLVSMIYSYAFAGGITAAKEVAFVTGSGLALLVTAVWFFFKRAAGVWTINYIDAFAAAFILYELVVYFINKKADISVPVFPLILLCTLLLYILINAWLRTKSNMRQIVYILLVATGVLHVLVGYLQYAGVLSGFHYFFRVTGMFFNPGPFAIYLSILMVIAFAGCLFFFYVKKYKTVFLLSVFLAAAAWLLCILQSRSAFLALLCGILSVAGMHLKKIQPSFIITHKKKIAVLVLFSLPLLGWMAMMGYHMKEGSAKGRLLSWKVASDIVKNNIMTGVGPANFPAASFQYQHNLFERDKTAAAQYRNLAAEGGYAFNDLLQITCEGGIIALLLFMTLLFLVFFSGARYVTGAPFVQPVQTAHDYKYLLLLGAWGGLAAFVVAGIFSYPFSVLPLQLLFWLLVACVSCTCSSLCLCRVVIRKVYSWAIVCLLLAPALFMLIAGCRRSWAFGEWQRIESNATARSSLKEIPAQLSVFSHVLGDDGGYLLTLGIMLLANKQTDRAIAVLEKAKKMTNDKTVYYCLGKAFETKGDYRLAEEQYRFVATTIPSLIRPYYLVAKMYYDLKAYELFHNAAAEVIAFEPKISNIETEKMKNEIAALMVDMEQRKN